MSALLKEKVVRVPPVKMEALERLGEEFARMLGATLDGAPRVLDWADLVENQLAKTGLLFFPVTAAELPDCEGATDPSGKGPIRILIREDVYDALGASGRRANRPRATIVHETSHALLHVPYIRQIRGLTPAIDTLNRVSRDTIPAYADPEWQAWALAGAILAPRRTIAPMLADGASALEIADAHGISEQFLRAHAGRLKIAVPRTSDGAGLLRWENGSPK